MFSQPDQAGSTKSEKSPAAMEPRHPAGLSAGDSGSLVSLGPRRRATAEHDRLPAVLPIIGGRLIRRALKIGVRSAAANAAIRSAGACWRGSSPGFLRRSSGGRGPGTGPEANLDAEPRLGPRGGQAARSSCPSRATGGDTVVAARWVTNNPVTPSSTISGQRAARATDHGVSRKASASAKRRFRTAPPTGSGTRRASGPRAEQFRFFCRSFHPHRPHSIPSRPRCGCDPVLPELFPFRTGVTRFSQPG